MFVKQRTLLGEILRKGFLISLRPAVIPLNVSDACGRRRRGSGTGATNKIRINACVRQAHVVYLELDLTHVALSKTDKM